MARSVTWLSRATMQSPRAVVGPRLRTAILASHKAAAAATPARAVASLRAAAVGAAAADIQLPTANRAMALTKVH